MNYLLVNLDFLSEIMSRLDSIVHGQPGTLHYTHPIPPLDPSYPFVLLPIDDRAQSVLTPEEWASRIATMPAEFVPPDPLTP